MRIRVLTSFFALMMLGSGCTVVAWGGNADGQLGTGDTAPSLVPAPSIGAGWANIESGGSHTCGLRTDGTAWCWGSNGQGRLGAGVDHTTLVSSKTPMQVGSGSDWVEISVAPNHSCAMRSDDTVWCWGWNQIGQLGDGTNLDANAPVQVVGGVTSWATMDVGRSSTCAIGTDGTAWCWGYNNGGKLGDGTATDSNVPVQVAGGATDWSGIAVGANTTCATRTSGTAWCWGSNGSGQLGNGTTISSATPVEVAGAASWSMVLPAVSHTCGIQTDGSAWCWGRNYDGELGIGVNDAGSTVPVPVTGGITDWTMIDAGTSDVCGVRAEGTAWCWGSSANVPVAVAGGHTDWVSVDLGSTNSYYTNCGIRAGDTAWCWGWNLYGQLGNGQASSTETTLPVQLESNADWVQVAAAAATSCKRTATQATWPYGGTVACFGDNAFGQLGTGDTLDRTNPTPILGNWAHITVGEGHTCGIKLDGTAWCWGRNDVGQVGDGTTANASVPVQVAGGHSDWGAIDAGGAHTCGLRGTQAYCWGDNAEGQLGNGGSVDSDVPSQVAQTNSFTSITTGRAHTCAVRDDNGLRCWGDGSSGQLGQGTTTNAYNPAIAGSGGLWAHVEAGADFTCAISLGLDRRLFCTGDNTHGQLGIGSNEQRRGFSAVLGGLSGFHSLGAGSDHVCAVQTTVNPNALWCWGSNADGQLGDGTTNAQTQPVQIGAGTSWLDVDGGDRHTIAIES